MTCRTSYLARVSQYISRAANIKVILAAYLALGVAYSLSTPIFEAPDEMNHFAYVKNLVDGRGFPGAPVVKADDLPAQESSQPPLYYLSAALAVRLLAPDTNDFAQLLVHNPAFPEVNSDISADNKNVFIHTLPETFPGDGTARAVHVARLVALAFGLLTIWSTYRLSGEAFPERSEVARLAASIVAFTPQFIFISSSINNDSAVAATSALARWVTVRVMRLGFTRRRAVALGLTLGSAMLSKDSALVLAPIALFATIAIDAAETLSWKKRARYALFTLVVTAGVIGLWVIRSWLIFGDPLGISTHLITSSARPVPLGVVEALSQLSGAFISYWLAFGWSTILAPDWVYYLFGLIMVIGLGGAAGWALKHWPDRRQAQVRFELAVLAVLTSAFVGIFIALVRWLELHNASLGRLLFPAISALSVLLAIGWLFVTRRPHWAAAMPVGLAALSAVALVTILLPAYTPPPLRSAREIDQQAGQPIDVRYGEVGRLIRLSIPHDAWPQPGGKLNLQLCWEPLQRDARLLMILVQIVGAQNRVVASRRTLPGLGTYPTSDWTPGTFFCDPVQVTIDSHAPAPAVYWVEVSMLDPQTGMRLPAYSPSGTALTTDFVGKVKIASEVPAIPVSDHAVSYRLGDQIELIGYDFQPASMAPGDSAKLRLYWRALRRPERDYTVFVHVRDSSGKQITDADGPPQSGAYATSYWDAGEVVVDEHTINLPLLAHAGVYQIVVGMYTLDDGIRLPVTNGASSTEIQLPLELTVHSN